MCSGCLVAFWEMFRAFWEVFRVLWTVGSSEVGTVVGTNAATGRVELQLDVGTGLEALKAVRPKNLELERQISKDSIQSAQLGRQASSQSTQSGMGYTYA